MLDVTIVTRKIDANIRLNLEIAKVRIGRPVNDITATVYTSFFIRMLPRCRLYIYVLELQEMIFSSK